MDRLEELVRDSLHQRAHDVEPTPALWDRVERKVARRRWSLVLTWSLAGAAAVLAAVVALPMLLDGDPFAPEIMGPRPPASPSVDARHVLLARTDGAVVIRDLGSGQQEVAWDGDGRRVTDLAAAPGATAADFVAVAFVTDGTAGSVVMLRRAGGGAVTVRETAAADLPGGRPGHMPLVALAPDGDWIVYDLPPGTDLEGPLLAVPIDPTTGALRTEAVVDLGGNQDLSRVVEWRGRTARPGDRSTLLLAGTSGVAMQLELERTADGFAGSDFSRYGPVDDRMLVDVGQAWLGAAEADPSFVLLEYPDGGLELGYLTSDSRPFAPLALDAIHDGQGGVTLDARGSRALLVTGGRAWLVTVRVPDDPDAPIGFDAPAPLADDVTAGALLGGLVVPAGDGAPAGELTDPPPTNDTPAATRGDVAVALVQADLRRLVLRRPDADDATLLELHPEGGSTVRAVAVRPGSTPDDLVMVAVTTAEGFHDLRWVEVVGGQALSPQVIDTPDHRPAASMDSGVTVEGLAWSPDGTTLAWLERDVDGTGTTLRTIGWGEGPGTGDTATDNASFDAGELDGTSAALVDWIDAGEGRSVLRFTHTDSTVWWRWIVERQPDGAIAVPPGSAPGEVAGPQPGATVVALGGADDEGMPTWMLAFDDDGAMLLADPYGRTRPLPVPEDLPPGDGLPDAWLRAAADGVLVGGSGQAWYVAADGTATALGEAVHAAVVR